MRPISDHDPLVAFDDELRSWSQRPPNVPASAARTRVMARFPEVSRPVPWLRLAAAAVMLLILAVAVWRGSPRPAGEASASAAAVTPPPLDRNVVVWVLDAHTTVYFVLSPVSSEREGQS